MLLNVVHSAEKGARNHLSPLALPAWRGDELPLYVTATVCPVAALRWILGFVASLKRYDAMTSITTTDASKRLDEVLDSLAESHEVAQIAGQRHSGVLVSDDDWRAIQETLHLTGIPGMRESIVEGLRTPVEQSAYSSQSIEPGG